MKFGHPTSTKPTPPQHHDASAPLPGTTPKRLADIVIGRECRWPVGEGVTTMCGCPVEYRYDPKEKKDVPVDTDGGGKGRYCPAHSRMSGIRLAPIVPGVATRLPKAIVSRGKMTSSVDPEWESA